MKVKVILNGHLSWYVEGQSRDLEPDLPAPATVGDLVDHLGVPAVEVAFATVDGERVDMDCVLTEGMEVSLIPVIAGG
ncbi:MAG: MoaD/ThiS family protein [Bacillota bacterium]